MIPCFNYGRWLKKKTTENTDVWDKKHIFTVIGES